MQKPFRARNDLGRGVLIKFFSGCFGVTTLRIPASLTDFQAQWITDAGITKITVDSAAPQVSKAGPKLTIGLKQEPG